MSLRILSIDIETFPMLGDVWRLWETNVIKLRRNTVVCAFSAKWLKGKQITRALPDYPGYKAGDIDDRKLIKELWGLLNEADIVVAQNGDRFDIKKINARLIKHGHNPPAPYKTVDTLKTARRIFGFDSNKLNDLCKFLGIGEKFHTGGFQLWDECMDGHAAAWSRMRRYNAQDVRLLEKLYLRFLPWTNNHPNVAVGRIACPKCMSKRVQSRGDAVTAIDTCPRYQCQACGGWVPTAVVRRWMRGTSNLRKAKPLVNAR